MYYPVTDAAMDTDSYDQFATGYYLSRKADGVVLGRLHARPERSASEITASPNRAAIEQLSGLPPRTC